MLLALLLVLSYVSAWARDCESLLDSIPDSVKKNKQWVGCDASNKKLLECIGMGHQAVDLVKEKSDQALCEYEKSDRYTEDVNEAVQRRKAEVIEKHKKQKEFRDLEERMINLYVKEQIEYKINATRSQYTETLIKESKKQRRLARNVMVETELSLLIAVSEGREELEKMIMTSLSPLAMQSAPTLPIRKTEMYTVHQIYGSDWRGTDPTHSPQLVNLPDTYGIQYNDQRPHDGHYSYDGHDSHDGHNSHDGHDTHDGHGLHDEHEFDAGWDPFAASYLGLNQHDGGFIGPDTVLIEENTFNTDDYNAYEAAETIGLMNSANIAYNNVIYGISRITPVHDIATILGGGDPNNLIVTIVLTSCDAQDYYIATYRNVEVREIPSLRTYVIKMNDFEYTGREPLKNMIDGRTEYKFMGGRTLGFTDWYCDHNRDAPGFYKYNSYDHSIPCEGIPMLQKSNHGKCGYLWDDERLYSAIHVYTTWKTGVEGNNQKQPRLGK